MAIRDVLGALLGRPNSGELPDATNVEWVGPMFRQMVLGLTPEELYRTQPYLRIVLSFVARNVAHLGLKAYVRNGDNDRERLRDGPLALLLRRPNSTMTGFELLETLASDLGLYDVAYWFVGPSNSASGWQVRPIPPSWVIAEHGGDLFEPASYEVVTPTGKRALLPAAQVLVFHGWNPGRPKVGASPIETLKQVLAEQVQAWSYREQVWQRGGRVGAYISRPKDSAWSDAARERFARDWKDRWTGRDGKKAGGTPILEDGMTLNRLGFSAREDEWSEVSKLALSTVASVYHVNPVMVGVLDNANFSNTREFRKMLYTETLGPTLARIEDRVNTFLVPLIATRPHAYVEFNVEEKLQGDFESQAAVLSTATGRPYMTADEARAKFNLPALGGDAERLVTPLNVLVGGQASPRDSGSQNQNAAAALVKAGPARPDGAASGRWSIRAKAAVDETYSAKAEEVLRGFFERQRRSVLSALGAKAPGWWDAKRWNDELAASLLALGLFTSKAAAAAALRAGGADPDDYDEGRTEAFLQDVAASRAEGINATTRDQVKAVLAGDGPEDADGPGHVFDVAAASRAAGIATALTTTFSAFGTTEAARQSGGGRKTWIVTSSNPRPEHAAMDGETADVDGLFSNGAKWPGDPVLGVDGVAGCTCDVEVTFG